MPRTEHSTLAFDIRVSYCFIGCRLSGSQCFRIRTETCKGSFLCARRYFHESASPSVDQSSGNCMRVQLYRNVTSQANFLTIACVSICTNRSKHVFDRDIFQPFLLLFLSFLKGSWPTYHPIDGEGWIGKILYRNCTIIYRVVSQSNLLRL